MSKYDFIAVTQMPTGAMDVYTPAKDAKREEKKLDASKYVKYLTSSKVYSSICLDRLTIGLGSQNCAYNFIQHGKRNVLYCLVCTWNDRENFGIDASSTAHQFLSVESDFGKICALIPPGRERISITKLDRKGTFHPLAIASTETDEAMIVSAQNRATDHTQPSWMIVSAYEAVPVPHPPPYVAPSAPVYATDGCGIVHRIAKDYEPARIVPGKETGQSFVPCTSFVPGKKLASVKIVMLVKKLKR